MKKARMFAHLRTLNIFPVSPFRFILLILAKCPQKVMLRGKPGWAVTIGTYRILSAA